MLVLSEPRLHSRHAVPEEHIQLLLENLFLPGNQVDPSGILPEASDGPPDDPVGDAHAGLPIGHHLDGVVQEHLVKGLTARQRIETLCSWLQD